MGISLNFTHPETKITMKFLGVLALAGIATAQKINLNGVGNTLWKNNKGAFDKCLARANSETAAFGAENQISGFDQYLMTASSLESLGDSAQFSQLKDIVKIQQGELDKKFDLSGKIADAKSLNWLQVFRKTMQQCRLRFKGNAEWQKNLKTICMDSAHALIPSGGKPNSADANKNVFNAGLANAQKIAKEQLIANTSCPGNRKRCTDSQRINTEFRKRFSGELRKCLKN